MHTTNQYVIDAATADQLVRFISLHGIEVEDVYSSVHSINFVAFVGGTGDVRPEDSVFRQVADAAGQFLAQESHSGEDNYGYSERRLMVKVRELVRDGGCDAITAFIADQMRVVNEGNGYAHFYFDSFVIDQSLYAEPRYPYVRGY